MNIDWQTTAQRFQEGHRNAFLDPGLRHARNELFKAQGQDIKLQRALGEGRLVGLQEQFYNMALRKQLAKMRIPTSESWVKR